ncbi:MAG: anti sigma factor C-terminal domain-containing protein [Clostridium sp.]
MTFRELLEKYKEGTLTEEEKKLVESELEKNEAINDYLAENLDLTSSFNSNEEIQSDITTNKVRKTVNRKLLKVVALSVIIVFAILFSVKYIISPLVSSQYYNPTKHSLSKYDQDFIFDLRALNEVVNPGYGISYASAQDNGFGNYMLTFESNNLFTQEKFPLSSELKKNEPYGMYAYMNTSRTIRYSTLWSDSKTSDSYKQMLEFEKKNTLEKVDYLKELPNTSYVSAYMLLDKELTLDDLRELMFKYESLRFNWAAIRVSDERIELPIGFRIDPDGDCDNMDKSYYKKYPSLLLSDYFVTSDPDSSSGFVPGYRKHFKSLLKYLSDHDDAVKSLSHFSLDFDQYLNYIETNGINVYGVLVFGTPDDIASLYENENILTIDIDNVLPSIYSTK